MTKMEVSQTHTYITTVMRKFDRARSIKWGKDPPNYQPLCKEMFIVTPHY